MEDDFVDMSFEVDHLTNTFPNLSKRWSLSWCNTRECKMTRRIRHSNLKSLFPHRLCHFLLITIYVFRSHCQYSARKTDVTVANINTNCKVVRTVHDANSICHTSLTSTEVRTQQVHNQEMSKRVGDYISTVFTPQCMLDWFDN